VFEGTFESKVGRIQSIGADFASLVERNGICFAVVKE
jgi:hypothetical protein